MPTIDPAQAGTDRLLAELETKIHNVYEQAAFEMQQKVEKRLANYEKQKKKMKELVAENKLTWEDFYDWRRRQLAINDGLKDLAEVLADDMHNYNLIAAKIANGGMADIYALNANYAEYEIEQLYQYARGQEIGSSFALYNHDTAEILLKEEQKRLLPAPSAKKLKELKQLKKTNPDILWNTQKMQSAILQGILQGEGAREIADRISSVGAMNERQAIRNARTMTTNVQNMGRNRSYLNSKDMGIDLTIQWYAVLDGVTRHSHRQMHGKTKKNTKTAKFPNGLRWPGDPEGPAGEVYNCRCTTVAWIKGFESDVQKQSNWLKKNGQSYDDWKQGKKVAKPASGSTTPPKLPNVTSIPNAQEFSEDYHIRHNYDDVWGKMTRTEKSGIRDYTGWEYTPMNEYMRFGEEEFLKSHSYDEAVKIKKKIENAAAGLEKSGLADDTRLYRGMGSKTRTLTNALGASVDEIDEMLRDGSIRGRSFVDQGFGSTGITGRKGWKKEVVLDIRAPKGTKGLYVDPISKNSGEKEILLQRNTVYQIYDFELIPDGYYGRTQIKLYVDIVGQLTN